MIETRWFLTNLAILSSCRVERELETDLSEASSAARSLCVSRRMSSSAAGSSADSAAELFTLLDLRTVLSSAMERGRIVWKRNIERISGVSHCS